MGHVTSTSSDGLGAPELYSMPGLISRCSTAVYHFRPSPRTSCHWSERSKQSKEMFRLEKNQIIEQFETSTSFHPNQGLFVFLFGTKGGQCESFKSLSSHRLWIDPPEEIHFQFINFSLSDVPVKSFSVHANVFKPGLVSLVLTPSRLSLVSPVCCTGRT